MKVDVKKTKIDCSISKQRNTFGTWYLLAQRIAKSVKPQTISQNFAFPCAKDTESVLMENSAAVFVKNDNYANNSSSILYIFPKNTTQVGKSIPFDCQAAIKGPGSFQINSN